MLIRYVIALALAAAPNPGAAQEAEARREVVTKVADLVQARYVDLVAAKRIAEELRRDLGDIPTRGTPGAFAEGITKRLRSLSSDGHFALEYAPAHNAVPEGDAIDPAELERWYGMGVNHGFENVARLEHGIGYLDLRVFAPTSMGRDLACAAMSLLAQSPAIIIDLRRNGGGTDEMTRLLAAYLLDERREMSGVYDRPSDRTRRNFTPEHVPGRRFGGTKPVYILASRRTFSAAEAFAYDLQAMGRATIIGERTGGGAHPFAYRPVAHGFVLSIPESRSINPITGGNWEGTGVQPDIRVPAEAALKRALAEARRAIRSDAP